MDEQNEKDIKDLFGKFPDAEKARQAAEDIRKSEKILREHSSPEPDGKLIADIKMNITRALMRKRASAFRKIVYKAAAVAAAVIIVTAIFVKVFEKEGGESERAVATSITPIPRAIWEGEDITADDVDLVMLTAEIEQIEDKLLTLQSGEDNGNGSTNIMELELELSGMDSDFWKG